MSGYATAAEAHSVKKHYEKRGDGGMWRVVKRGDRYYVERIA